MILSDGEEETQGGNNGEGEVVTCEAESGKVAGCYSSQNQPLLHRRAQSASEGLLANHFETRNDVMVTANPSPIPPSPTHLHWGLLRVSHAHVWNLQSASHSSTRSSVPSTRSSAPPTRSSVPRERHRTQSSAFPVLCGVGSCK